MLRYTLVLAAALVAAAPLRAQTASLDSAYAELYARWGRGDVAGAMRMLAPEYAWVRGGRQLGRAEQEERFRADSTVRRLAAAPRFEIADVRGEGDRVHATARVVALTAYREDNGEESAMVVEENHRDTWRRTAAGWLLERREEVRPRLVGDVAVVQSPRLRALLQRVAAGGAAAVDSFWSDAGGPLVEEIPGDAAHRLVTFLWRGRPGTRTVALLGSFPDRAFRTLLPLPGTDVWYNTQRLPADSRLNYEFDLWDSERFAAEEGEREVWYVRAEPDPRNPPSVLALPHAPPQPYVAARPGVPRGTLARDSLASAVLGQTRAYAVYTPPGHDPAKGPYPLLVLFDGQMYGGSPASAPIPTATILDNLVAEGRIPPVVAVLVHARDRAGELNGSEAFTRFVADELLPAVRRRTGATADPARTVIGGASLGGLAAAFAGLTRPEVFGNVLSQSGAFWIPPGWPAGPRRIVDETGWFITRVMEAPRVPVRFSLEAGWFEAYLLPANRHLRDVLRLKGYEVDYREFHGGHHAQNWRGTLADGLIALLGRPAP
ncbi:MAG TPA: alpha/beta hydrolase-fold protein [Longimicrobium sp.]|nr:alpha/beta hydrolase-fold protein [Longimicrobium sp.]